MLAAALVTGAVLLHFYWPFTEAAVRGNSAMQHPPKSASEASTTNIFHPAAWRKAWSLRIAERVRR